MSESLGSDDDLPVLRVGEELVFDVQSRVGGRLLLVDINADHEVGQILPNTYTRRLLDPVISTGEKLTVPNEGFGFRAFRVGPPKGLNRLLVVVTPDEFKFGTKSENMSRSATLASPLGYLMNLTSEVRAALQNGESSGTAAATDKWTMGVLEYKIQ